MADSDSESDSEGLPRLRKFRGDEDNFEEFLREVNALLSLLELPGKQAAQWILGALEGPARNLVLSYSPDECNTPKKILDILRCD